MAELQTNIGADFPFYRVRIPMVVVHVQEKNKRSVPSRPAEETKEECRPADAAL